jgi:hypothetical protein
MKRVFAFFLAMSLLGVKSLVACSYFRVSVSLEKCELVDPKTIKTANPYAVPSEIPELEEAPEQALVQVTCSCDYSLSGSDSLCDTDQTVERTSVITSEKLSTTCRRGAALCHEACPSRLP